MTIDRAHYEGIPADFPIRATIAAVGGAQPKLALVQEGEKFYAPGTAPSEVRVAFDMCEDLVAQMVPYCEKKLATFHGDQAATFKGVYQSLLDKNWCTPEQSAWIMRKIAERLSWPIPENVLPS